MQHKCEESKGLPFTLENRGQGWFLYADEIKGPKPINFCPYCGIRLGCDDCEFYVDYREAGKMCRLGYGLETLECREVRGASGVRAPGFKG